MGDKVATRSLWRFIIFILFRHFKRIRPISKAHVGPITNFAWGGTRLLSSGCDTSVKLWDLEKGGLVLN